MHTIFLTIVGPEQSKDLQLPAEIPIADLLTKLAELCAPRARSASSFDPTRWHLLDASRGVALERTRSFADLALVDGAILLLHDRALPRPTQQESPPTFQPRSVLPSERTGGIGVKWALSPAARRKE